MGTQIFQHHLLAKMGNLSLFAISHIFALCFCLVSIITIAETADIKLPEIQIKNEMSKRNESAASVKVQIAGKPEISLKFNDVYKWNVTRNEKLNCTASSAPYTVKWYAFDPSSDAGHAINYHAITSFGIYQSFDNKSYVLKADWGLPI